MGNAPENQPRTENAKGDAQKDSAPIIRPESAASTDAQPTNTKCCTSNKKCRWTQDPLMAALTAAGLVALIIYTAYTRLLVIDSENSSAVQARLTRDQLTLAYPPELRVGAIHIWEEGHGSPLNPSDQPPPLVPRTEIEGSVLAENFGSDSATIVRSDCLAIWEKGPLPMSNPLWGRVSSEESSLPKENQLSPYDEDTPPYGLTPLEHRINEMKSGALERWSFKKTVPTNASTETLYVIGYIFYKGSLGTYHELYFGRKYEPNGGAKGYFVPVEDSTYEREE